MQPPPLSERFTLGSPPYTCDEVAVFIRSLNSNSSLNDFEAICNIIQLFDFDTCSFFSQTKNETFDFFEMLLKKFHREIIQQSSLSNSLTYFAERFNFLKQAIDLDEKRKFTDRMRNRVDIRSEFFTRWGGNTVANKNIYDLAIYKRGQRIARGAELIARGAELRNARLMGGSGKQQPNRKKASRIRLSKKRFHSRKSHRKNKSRRKN
jgi:hypothetical protein